MLQLWIESDVGTLGSVPTTLKEIEVKLTKRLIYLMCFALMAENAFAIVTVEDINSAYYAGDTAALEQLRSELNEANSDDALLAGYLDWRAASILVGNGNDKAADKILKRGQATLEALVEKTPDSAEAWALLSTTLGMRIGIRPMTRGMTMGRRADKAIDTALALEPDNPRVLLISAIGKLNKPSMFGGDKEAAMQELDAAINTVAVHGTGRYAWGGVDAYVWRGIALKRAGENAAAVADFDRALAVVPSYGWAEQLRASVGSE